MSNITAILILAVVTSELIVSTVIAARTASIEDSSEKDTVSYEDYADRTVSMAKTADSSAEDDYDNSFSALQRTAKQGNRLTKTGVLGLKRCGKSIAKPINRFLSAKRRDIAIWNKNTLTYRIRDIAHGARPSTVSEFMKKAFNEWSKVTLMDFIEKNDPNVDIEINFGGLSHRWRGRACEFQDQDVLAHVNWPNDGDIHFNSKYFFPNGENMDLFLDTAIHEIGHSLGLDHSSSKYSIMYDTTGNQLFSKPQPEDVKRIQALYGVRRIPKIREPRKFCSLTKYDAAVDDEDGNWYIFSGNYYYYYAKNSYGRRISSKWPGITGSIDAACRILSSTYFFKGNQYWRFKGSQLEQGPRLISTGFPGFPNSIDAVFLDSNGKLNALKGSRVWIRTGRSVRSYSLRSKGLPSNVDAASTRRNIPTVYKGNQEYWFINGAFKQYRNTMMLC